MTGGPGAQRDGGGRSAGVDVWVRVRRERGDARAVSEGWLTCGPRWQADGAGALAWARGERVGELGRACLLGRARGRAGLIAGQAGMEPGRVRGGTGPAGLGWKKESEPWATSGFVGLTGLRVWVLFPFLFFSNTLKLN